MAVALPLASSRTRKHGTSEFKATCLAVLHRVRKTRNPVLVTRFGEPIAQVLPPPPSPEGEWLGAMKNHGEIRADLVAPVADLSEWEALR